MPDPDFYRDCLQQAYDELEAAAIGAPVPPKRRRRKKRA